MTTDYQRHKKVNIASWSNALPTTTYLVEDNTFQLHEVNGQTRNFIARGAGRSYGDGAYITDNITVSTKKMKRIANGSLAQGTIVCEPGVQLIDLHHYLRQSEWSFPIYGGSQWVTVGGAVAADIHGKNAHLQGAFGNHVQSLELITGTGEVVLCSRQINPDLFKATIGGMGLTGFIKKITLSLQKGVSKTVRKKTRSVSNLDELLECFNMIPSDFQVCSWVMCHHQASKGLYWYASYTEERPYRPRFSTTCWLPRIKFINRYTMLIGGFIEHLAHNNLDEALSILHFNYAGIHERLKNWNRLYGLAGCIEYHFAVAKQFFKLAFNKFITECRQRDIPVYIAVIKKFEAIEPEGLLSFMTDGYTMNILIDNTSENKQFLIYFTDFILELQGKIYLAKDSCLLPVQFEKMYANLAQWQTIGQKYDPCNKFQSNLSKRLGLKPW